MAFDGVPVLTGVDLTVAPGELVVLLGPSGCGKSTLLRTVAGLEQPTAGGVWWGGVDLTGVPTHERGFGLVFQDHALFGHRDVAGNVDFGLRVAGMSPDQRAHRVARALALVGLGWLRGPEGRHPVGWGGPAGCPGSVAGRRAPAADARRAVGVAGPVAARAPHR
ncbi:MAG: hypothetical protein CM1200mP26_01640 [Acidimicrobiales bacterium]|nr:MAG: hypothetical protein CM1200mP26_01640 [Acidimicrobiales bacterium]